MEVAPYAATNHTAIAVLFAKAAENRPLPVCFEQKVKKLPPKTVRSKKAAVDRLLGTKTYCNAVENTKYTVIDLSRKCKKYNNKNNK